MRSTFKPAKWAALIVAAAALGACGGDGDDDDDGGGGVVTPPVTSEVPPSASQSVSGFIAYLQALVVASADLLEPVDTSGVTAPADDTGDPVPVN